MEYLIITLVCFIVYFKSLRYGLVVDDVDAHKREPFKNINILSKIRHMLNGGDPIRNIPLDHLLTLCIHTTVCLLMYKAFGNLPAALLFAVNISNNQVSLWLNGKRYGVNAILCLLAFIFPSVGLLFWLLIAYFQPSGFTFILLLAIMGYWHFLLITPMFFLLGNKYVVRWIKGRAKRIDVSELKCWNWKKPILICKTIGYYFIRGIVPSTPLMYIKFLMHYGCTKEGSKDAYKITPMFFFGLFLIIIIPIIYMYNTVIGLGLIWWLITISVFSNWVTLTVPIAERYMYLPNVGLMLSLSVLLSYIHPFAWFIVFGIYIARLYTFMGMYKDLDTYLEHHTYYDPKCDCSWVFRINKAKKADAVTALNIVDQGLARSEHSPRLWIHKATLAHAFGNNSFALQCLVKAEQECKGEFVRLLKPKIDYVRSMIKEEK